MPSSWDNSVDPLPQEQFSRERVKDADHVAAAACRQLGFASGVAQGRFHSNPPAALLEHVRREGDGWGKGLGQLQLPYQLQR